MKADGALGGHDKAGPGPPEGAPRLESFATDTIGNLQPALPSEGLLIPIPRGADSRQLSERQDQLCCANREIARYR